MTVFPNNYTSASGFVYINPVTSQVNVGFTGYKRAYPALYKRDEVMTQIEVESAPYNSATPGLLMSINAIAKALVAQTVADTNIVLDPAATAGQIAEASSDFYTSANL